jgi:hypothetical protein
MQNAPHPRFRLEIGLLKLVYAGRLQPIEKVLAQWNPGAGSGPEPGSARPKRGGGTSAAPAEARAGNGAAYGVATEPEELPPLATARLAAAAGAGAKPGFGAAAAAIRETRTSAPERPAPPTASGSDAAREGASESQARLEQQLGLDEGAPEAQGDRLEQEGLMDHRAAQTSARGEEDSDDLSLRLAGLLRSQGDDSLADALDHGRVEVQSGRVEIRSLPDYRAVLEIGLATVQEAARSVLANNARVTLGSDLGPAEPALQAVPNSAHVLDASRPTSGGESVPGPSEAVQRALADPEVQRIQKLFAGQIREVRNLRGYTT